MSNPWLALAIALFVAGVGIIVEPYINGFIDGFIEGYREWKENRR